MSEYYGITCQVIRHKDGWNQTSGIPYFTLNRNVQGIVSNRHAAILARMIVDRFHEYEVVVTVDGHDTCDSYSFGVGDDKPHSDDDKPLRIYSDSPMVGNGRDSVQSGKMD